MISLKLDSLAYISAAESINVSSVTFTQSAPKATEFGEITLRLGLYAVQGKYKVTEFGVPIESSCDFLLVINTNFALILHRFRDIAFDRSKIAILAIPLVYTSPDGTISVKFCLDVNRWPTYQMA